MTRYTASGDILPYSDRKAMRSLKEAKPWLIEDIVLAQRMACEGKLFEEIARTLGRTSAEVVKMVDPEPKDDRQERVGSGYADVKSVLWG